MVFLPGSERRPSRGASALLVDLIMVNISSGSWESLPDPMDAMIVPGTDCVHQRQQYVRSTGACCFRNQRFDLRVRVEARNEIPSSVSSCQAPPSQKNLPVLLPIGRRAIDSCRSILRFERHASFEAGNYSSDVEPDISLLGLLASCNS